MESIIYTETLRGGAMASLALRRGLALRITAEGAGANLSALFFNADHPLERYNMPDTLKAQCTAFLSAGKTLHSDMGRVLCSLTAESCGWHDTLCGILDARRLAEKFGARTYQEARNDWRRNGRDNFLVELAKHGLGKRDLHANVNFFSKVVADESGNLSFVPDHAKAGDFVELRAEMDILVVLSNTPHPLAPAGEWDPPAVTLTVRAVPAPGPDDSCRVSRPENGRAFANTESYVALETA
ncbi:MAG TPA: urea amidolyase associated protein UAAP1 [Fibrobacteria bacterium]|nr:urea amidolyase associated protein UAAP1 [Fibrobacteria bacterium]